MQQNNSEKTTNNTRGQRIFTVAVSVASLIAILAAVFFAAKAFWTVQKNYEAIEAATIIQESADEEAAATDVIPDADVENTADAEVNFSYHDGAFFLSGSKIPLDTENGTVAVHFPDGEYQVVYDKAAGFLEIGTDAGDIYVTVSKMSDTSDASALYVFENEEDEQVIAGRIVVGECELSLYGDPKSAETVDALKEMMAGISDGTAICSQVKTVSINGYSVNSEWTDNITASDEFVSFSKDSELVNFSAYTNTTEGAGFTNKVSVEGVGDFLYGSYQDASSGLRPYIHNSESGMMKIMASGEESLNALFSVPVADPAPVESGTTSVPQE